MIGGRVAEDVNFAATLTRWARIRPNQSALIEPAGHRAGRPQWRSITFAELESLADQYAVGLSRADVRAGDRVLYLLRPTIESYAVFYALLRLRAIPVLIDPRMGLRRLRDCVEAIGPRVLLAEPLFHSVRMLAPRVFAATELAFTSGQGWWPGLLALRHCRASSGSVAAEPARPEDECYLPFTSGSTGPAKGVFYTHGMVHAQVSLMREVCGWREGMGVVMCFAPFVIYALADGLTAILPEMDFSRPAAARPERIIEAITAHGAECAFASPVVWMNLARYGERTRSRLPTLRRAVASGAPVQADLHRRLETLLHAEGRLYTPYGATEAMPLTTADSVALAKTSEQTRSGYGTCVGTPLSGIELRVMRIDDQPIPCWSDDLCVPEGVIGELVVGAAVVSPAYWRRPDETGRAKIARGNQVLHRTGDLGRLDAEGRVWFCGRKSHRIETADGMLASVCMENIFNQHPRVFRTAVVGVGPPAAQVPVACVELERGEILSPRLEAELAALADPTEFKGVILRFLAHPGFPVDARHNSKIRREELAVWAGRRLGIDTPAAILGT